MRPVYCFFQESSFKWIAIVHNRMSKIRTLFEIRSKTRETSNCHTPTSHILDTTSMKTSNVHLASQALALRAPYQGLRPPQSGIFYNVYGCCRLWEKASHQKVISIDFSNGISIFNTKWWNSHKKSFELTGIIFHDQMIFSWWISSFGAKSSPVRAISYQ
jgi:hypothetical protein